MLANPLCRKVAPDRLLWQYLKTPIRLAEHSLTLLATWHLEQLHPGPTQGPIPGWMSLPGPTKGP